MPPATTTGARKSQRPRRPVPDGTTTSDETTVHDTAEWGAPGAIAAADAWRADPTESGIRFPHRAGDADDVAGRDGGDRLRGGRSRVPLFAALGLAGLAIVVLAVAAWLFLPSATIALTPRRDALAPIELTVSADPTATSVDAANNIVPAVRLEVPVEAQRTFTTTGVKVKETTAGGQVTFTNYDPTSTNTIPAGSIVSTEGGIRFRTLATLIVPRASFTPPTTTVPADATVAIQAVRPGKDGNVPANAIRVVPPGENSLFLAVHNAQDTTGGTHTETPQVSQAEVDQAVATLQADLTAAFRQNIAAGAGAPVGTTLFPDTAEPGAVTPDIDPATLVGQAVPTFDLKLSETGTVIAVDPTPVKALAQAALAAAVDSKHRLIPDSVVIDVGAGSVGEDKQVTFLAIARASEIAIVDVTSVRALVKGKTADAARTALAPFGDANVTIWPDWAATITTFDSRLTITVDDGSGAGATGQPSGGPGTGPSPGPSLRPSPAVGGAPSGRPAPSAVRSGPSAGSRASQPIPPASAGP